MLVRSKPAYWNAHSQFIPPARSLRVNIIFIAFTIMQPIH